VGAFHYEALLREGKPYRRCQEKNHGHRAVCNWEIYMLAGFGKLNLDEVGTNLSRSILYVGHPDSEEDYRPATIEGQENLRVLRRYLPNAYIRAKATFTRDVDAFGEMSKDSMNGVFVFYRFE
jgi:hypothetical protein